jgi:uncharacterized membrane-anchored protein
MRDAEMASSARTRARSLLSPRSGRRREPAGGAIHGRARLGRKTKDLVKRLGPDDVAIIDHADIDRIAAEELIATGVRAVVNVASSSTGRYPNPGPLLLVQAGVRLVDAPGATLFDDVKDGEQVIVDGGDVRVNGSTLVSGHRLGMAELARQMEDMRERIDEALEAFAENTVTHIRHESAILSGRVDFPATRTDFRDRHVLIVVRGTTHHKDLRTLRAYIQDVRPLLVGVDGGADALLEAGLRPDLILGDMDSASDAALGGGAELIVHAYSDGRAPGRERLERLGLAHTVVPAAGTSQDVAMLLAYEKGAALIVSVGAHFNLIEFLDKSRDGMSSTFLTRLRIGETLVDAKGVSRLYAPGLSGGSLALLFAASLVALVIAILTIPALDNLVELLWLKIQVLLGL